MRRSLLRHCGLVRRDGLCLHQTDDEDENNGRQSEGGVCHGRGRGRKEGPRILNNPQHTINDCSGNSHADHRDVHWRSDSVDRWPKIDHRESTTTNEREGVGTRAATESETATATVTVTDAQTKVRVPTTDRMPLVSHGFVGASVCSLASQSRSHDLFSDESNSGCAAGLGSTRPCRGLRL